MIFRWTVQALIQAPGRFLGSTLAVAAAFLLVLVFRAVWEGETRQLAAYLENAGADVWVMQEDVSNMHMASSFITQGKRNEIERVRDVESVASILYVNTMVTAGDEPWFSYVVGVEEPGQLGGPWSVPEGSAVVEPGEAIIPRVLSELTDTGIGADVRIGDRSFRVVGLSDETFSVTNPITFVHVVDLSDLLSLDGYDSYVLVRGEPGVTPATLVERILDEVDGVSALTTEAFVRSDIRLASQMGTEVLAFMTGICGVLAVLLVGFALYIHTAHHRRDLAILKAVGFRNRHVYLSVLLQAVVLTGLAFALAVGGSVVVSVVGPRLIPLLSLSLSPSAVLAVGATGLVVAVLGTLAVAHRVGRVDPLSVFSP